MPWLLKTSVSITAGPPAWVIIAILRPFGAGNENIEAMSTSSERLYTLTMPALAKRAFTASSGVARAPVCDVAARLPSSL